MNRIELKNFAVNARRDLLKLVALRANLFGIDEKTGLTIEEEFGQLVINGKTYPAYMKSTFRSLQKQLELKGYEQLVEEVAYIWFNRIIAIRFMEVHDYLPERVNVLSSNTGRVDPDILTEYESMDLPVDKQAVMGFLNSGDTEGAYRKLFIAQCNALNEILPFMFEKIQDFSELLLPDFLLDRDSIINTLVKNDELTRSFEAIEVIGWLYQYYITEEKDRVFREKKKYKKEEIPFATQLFTPSWIVQYMVQNSLGRYWTEAHPDHEDLIGNWDYFLKHEEEDFKEKIAPYVNKELKVEDIKCFDPAMGSGHILVYMFDILYEIYSKCGYMEREIPKLILENNLYGLDIDNRANQLACFSVVMKALQYNKRFLRSIQRNGITLNLASIQETNNVTNEVIAYIAGEEHGKTFKQVEAFFKQYQNAKTYGSLINITERDTAFLEKRLQYIISTPVQDLFHSDNHDVVIQILPDLIKQTQIMRNGYDVVVMNPPYMGLGNMNKELSDFLKKYYPNSKADLFAAFMEVDHYLNNNSFYAAINQHSWMFLSSFEKLRQKILNNNLIDTMLHLGPKAFEDIGGEVVQSTSFVYRHMQTPNISGIFIRLTDIKNAQKKHEEFLKAIHNNSYSSRYSFNQNNFRKIPGNTIAYWINENLEKIFEKRSFVSDAFEVRNGITTGSNEKFIRYWFEVDQSKKHKWYPCNKGGEFRRWYGNHYYVIDWENDGENLKSFKDEKGKMKATLRSIEFNFQEAITMSRLTTSGTSFRWLDKGFITEGASNNIYFDYNNRNKVLLLLGLLNTKVGDFILSIYNPTINIMPDNIRNIPYLQSEKDLLNIIQDNIKKVKNDWDCFELSSDFKKNFLLSNMHLSLLKDSYLDFKKLKLDDLVTVKKNEIYLNEVFINLYGLQDYLTPDIEDDNISIYQPELSRDVRSFLSYFIGCTVGRYSTDIDGLVYAGGEWNDSNYESFKPNKYGTVQFTDSQYFDNDIITRLNEFLAVAFSPDTVDENMNWLAEALEMKKGEDADTRLRRYFMDEFFVDHCKLYQKRPIYWLVDSGKLKGLRTLIYMHRYQSDTMATIRFEHLQEIQAKYNNEIDALEMRIVNPNLSATEKRNLEKQKTIYKKRLEELIEFDKKLAEYANEQIDINLDDGVKVNYAMFDKVLAKIK